jgi:predicted adenylyl cyclase CyaB
MNNIEVELRSFISQEKYQELLDFFKKEGQFLNEDYQETFYFDTQEDIRIQKNNFFSKIWMKKGKMHDAHREEIEIKFDKEDFEKLEKIFLNAGLNVKIKWFRTRHNFNWKETSVAVDYTKGYGYILEIEKMSNEENKEKDLQLLLSHFKDLNIELTPKEIFDKQFNNYKENWKSLI